MKKILAITLVSLFACASMAFAEAKVAADLELNPTFDSLSNGSTVSTMDFGGRVQVTVSAKIENKDTGFFFASQTQILAKTDGTAGTDDAWGQLGTSSFSLKVGRFEAQSLLDAGEDIYVAGAGGTWYTANNARGRTNGGLALDFNASENLMIEIGAIYGNTTSTFALVDLANKTYSLANLAQNKTGVRPLVKFTSGNITAVAGADIYMESPKNTDIDGSTTKIGFGGMIIAKVSNITIGGGAASGKTEVKDYKYLDTATGTVYNVVNPKQTVTSMKAWVNIPVGENLVGIGGGYTTEDLLDSKEMYGFVVYEMKLPVEGAWLKFAGSFASATDLPGGDQTDVGGRVRFAYAF